MPMLPTVIEGVASINGAPAPQNTTVEARIGGVAVKTAETKDGQYIMAIKGDASTVGKQITLYVSGIKTNATTTWESGKVETIDLSVTKKSNTWLYLLLALAAIAAVIAASKKKRRR